MNRAMSVASIEGEVLAEALLNATQMARMNFAREEFRRLERLLLKVVLPALGDYDLPVSHEVRRHLEQVRTFSGSFCHGHRHIGICHDAKAVHP